MEYTRLKCSLFSVTQTSFFLFMTTSKFAVYAEGGDNGCSGEIVCMKGKGHRRMN